MSETSESSINVQTRHRRHPEFSLSAKADESEGPNMTITSFLPTPADDPVKQPSTPDKPIQREIQDPFLSTPRPVFRDKSRFVGLRGKLEVVKRRRLFSTANVTVEVVQFCKTDIAKALKDGFVVDIVPPLIADELRRYMNTASRRTIQRCEDGYTRLEQGTRYTSFCYISKRSLSGTGCNVQARSRPARRRQKNDKKWDNKLMPVMECYLEGLKQVLAQAVYRSQDEKRGAMI